MFREISYITLILSAATFGTEIIFRLNPENQALGENILSSNTVIASAVIEIAASLVILRYIEKIPKFRMKILMLVILTPLITAIVLRSKYNFFMPLEHKRFNVYNATSFFLCLATIVWATLWFFKSEAPLIDPEIAASEEIERRMRRNEDRNNRSRSRDNVHNTTSLHRYDEEIDYTLPSYFEVPPPPAYIKAISSSSSAAQIEQVENIPLSDTESSSQNRNSIIETTVDNRNIGANIINEADIIEVEDNHTSPHAIHGRTSVTEVTEINQSARQ